MRPSSYTTFARIEDGLSKTLFIGEKHVPENFLGRGTAGDNSIYNPDYLKSHGRFGGVVYGGLASASDGSTDSTVDTYNKRFGSWHPGICHFVWGDASVSPIRNDVDEVVLFHLCHRFDAAVVSPSDYQ